LGAANWESGGGVFSSSFFSSSARFFLLLQFCSGSFLFFISGSNLSFLFPPFFSSFRSLFFLCSAIMDWRGGGAAAWQRSDGRRVDRR
jgi:hypothetical protein